MHFLRSLSQWIRRRAGRPDFEATMAEEMRLHLEHRIDQHVRAGLSPREAREAALRAFGGVAQIQEACRDQQRGLWLEQLARDVRYTARQLRLNPGFAAVAVVTLALGTGATTAIFSIVNAVVLSPLPLAEPDRLVWLAETNLRRDLRQFSVSYANYRDWTERSRSWEGLAAFTNRSVNLLYGGRPEHVDAQFMTASLLPTLRLSVARGRGFRPEEDAPGQANVVILSDGLWKRVFGGDPNIVGQP
ncbi:MAG: permease prefix domain 1-containing protein, partial [Vicinamibacterales bacterium]